MNTQPLIEFKYRIHWKYPMGPKVEIPYRPESDFLRSFKQYFTVVCLTVLP